MHSSEATAEFGNANTQADADTDADDDAVYKCWVSKQQVFDFKSCDDD